MVHLVHRAHEEAAVPHRQVPNRHDLVAGRLRRKLEPRFHVAAVPRPVDASPLYLPAELSAPGRLYCPCVLPCRPNLVYAHLVPGRCTPDILELAVLEHSLLVRGGDYYLNTGRKKHLVLKIGVAVGEDDVLGGLSRESLLLMSEWSNMTNAFLNSSARSFLVRTGAALSSAGSPHRQPPIGGA